MASLYERMLVTGEEFSKPSVGPQSYFFVLICEIGESGEESLSDLSPHPWAPLSLIKALLHHSPQW